MNFKPIDEMSLRQLFSTAFAQELLRLAYLGPVVNAAGAVETSPDAMILDMRRSPYQPLRCEFKFSPGNKDDFSHNGRFDIAIVWSLPQGCNRNQLTADLLGQNECSEVVVLSDTKAFRDLPPYSMDALSRLGGADVVREKALKTEFPSVCALFWAAKLYPNKFRMDRMVDYLAKRFPAVKKMQPKGRANVVTAFIQTKPPLLSRMHGNYFRWSSECDSVVAVGELSELIVSRFGEALPPDTDVEEIQQL